MENHVQAALLQWPPTTRHVVALGASKRCGTELGMGSWPANA